MQEHWGYGVKQASHETEFAQDIDRIFLNLFVIDNNGPESVGGGGTPRAPLAPPFLGDGEDDPPISVGGIVMWLLSLCV